MQPTLLTYEHKKGKQKFSIYKRGALKLTIVLILERKRSFAGSEISRQEDKLHCQSFNSDKKKLFPDVLIILQQLNTTRAIPLF